MNILVITAEWPSKQTPLSAPFVVRQVDMIKLLGVKVDVLHVKGSGNPLNYISNYFRLRKLLKVNKYDLIHAQWGQSGIIALFARIPLVVTFRGDDIEGIINNRGKQDFRGYFLKFIGRLVSAFSDFNIVVSEHMIEKLWSKKEKIAVIPSGINFRNIPSESKIFYKNKYNFPSEKKVLIFPNNVEVKRKNFKLIEQAVSLLPDNIKEKIELKVVYGFKHQEILEQMMASDILVFASIHEGSPNVVKEALACNLPIVSVDVADVKGRIEKISGCFVSDSYSVQDYSNALLKAINYDYSNYESRSFAKELDEEILASKLISIYKGLIK